MLQNPSEREKLLLKIPEVIAEELEPEETVVATSEKIEGSGCSPKSILRGSSDVSSTDASGYGDSLAASQDLFRDSHAPSIHKAVIDDVMPLKNPNGFGDSLALSQALVSDSHALGIHNPGIHDIMPLKNPNGDSLAPSEALASDSHAPSKGIIDNVIPLNPNGQEETYKKSEQVTEIGDQPVVNSGEKCPQEKPKVPTIITSVIDLSDDESEDEASKIKGRSSGECPDDVIWYYVDPKGQRRGPFSLLLLKKWSDANYFHSGFTVWKDGKTSNDGELLVDVIRRVFRP